MWEGLPAKDNLLLNSRDGDSNDDTVINMPETSDSSSYRVVSTRDAESEFSMNESMMDINDDGL